MAFIFLGILGFAAWKFQPWQEDWALVRYWLGQGHVHDVRGEWDIVKAIRLKPQQSTVIAARASGGYFKFSDKGSVKLNLKAGDNEIDGSGTYKASGRTISVVNLRTQDGIAKLPTTMNLNLTWQGPDTFVASVSPNELIYMQRRKQKTGLARLMQFGVKPGANAPVPEAMKGIIGKMKEQINSEQ